MSRKGPQTYPRQCEACGVIVMSAFEDVYDGHEEHERQLAARRFGYKIAPYVFAILVVAVMMGLFLLGRAVLQ